jgi:hypothetical protein
VPGDLRPADPAAMVETLSRALLYEGRRRVHDADQVLGRVTAEVLLAHLVGAGFVVMKRDGAAPPSTSGMPAGAVRALD